MSQFHPWFYFCEVECVKTEKPSPGYLEIISLEQPMSVICFQPLIRSPMHFHKWFDDNFAHRPPLVIALLRISSQRLNNHEFFISLNYLLVPILTLHVVAYTVDYIIR